MRNKKFLIFFIVFIIIALSIVSHFAFFGHPNETVFDEVHFGKFVSGYLNHKYFFDIHPPLGKLMISAVAKISGYKTGFGFKDIGETYPDKSYVWLRILPVFMGTLLPLVIFFIARELNFSILASFSVSLLIIFENAILGQSLFILLDSTLLLFGFLGLLLYLISRRILIYPHTKIFGVGIYILAIFCLACSLSIKWTGASFLALVFILEIYDYISLKLKDKKIINFWPRILIMIFLPLIFYFSIFCLHFAILNRSGDGDAFHTKEFQSTLLGNYNQNDPMIKKANIFDKFIELNIEMFRSNGRIQDNHPYSSKWFTWPMMAKPIYYWNDDDTANQAKIYLFGNPIIFWGSFMGIVILILEMIFFFKIMLKKIKTIIFILVGFVLNFIPFIFITRPMFLYHYLIALIFSIFALCFVIDLVKKRNFKILIFAIILALSLASFFFFSPLTYGLKMSPNSFNARLWTKNWQ